MLQRLSTTTPPRPRQRQPLGHVTVTGQSLAKNHARTPYGRAQLAARWSMGAATIQKPTAKQAANLFGVCEALIREARQKLEATTVAASPLEAAWQAASPAEREAFARAHPADLWDLIERITR